MEIKEAISNEFGRNGFDLSRPEFEAERKFVDAITEIADRSEHGAGVAMRLGIVLKYAAHRMTPAGMRNPSAEPPSLREALAASLKESESYTAVVGEQAQALIDRVSDLVISALGEMPMPGEQATAMRGLGMMLKEAGKTLSIEKQATISR
jgi:hypothetical protein